MKTILIKEHQPRYNIRLKDDKRYPYLKVTVNEPFPGLYITRQKENDGAKYFGPFVHTRATRQTIKQLTKVFPIRTCSLELKASGNPHRACLDYHIQRCPGPCANLTSVQDYDQIVKNVPSISEWRYSDSPKESKRKDANSCIRTRF